MDSKFKSRWNKFLKLVFLGVLMSILLIGFLRTVFLPTDYNYYENRYRYKIIQPSISSILDHSFQDSMENALQDQLPISSTVKKAYNYITRNSLTPALSGLLSQNNEQYISYFALSIFGDHYVYLPDSLESVKDTLDARAENYNRVMEAHPDIDFYAYYIEKETEVNLETNEKSDTADYMLSQLNIDESQKGVFRVDGYEDFSEYFYKTDHHWNHKGSYTAYRQLVELLGCSDAPLEATGEYLLGDFEGSKSSTVASHLLSDQFFAYAFEFPDYQIMIDGKPADNYGNQEQCIASGHWPGVSYAGFYGNDNGEIIFDTGKESLDNILIIGESYDNAILKLLASHFHKTYSIDLRNYYYAKGNDFNFHQFVQENEIDKVLFIGNLGFYLEDSFILE